MTPVGKVSILSANTASPSNGFHAASSNRPIAAVGADDLEAAVAIGDVGRRRLEPLGGEVAAALDHHVGGALQGRAADDGRGRAAGAAAVRDGAGVALAHLDALDRHAQRLGEDLREHRLVPLALALRAGMGDQPVGRDLDDGMLVGDAAGAVQMAGEAQAAQLARWPRWRRAARRSPARRRPSAPSRTGPGSRRRRRCSRWPPCRACRPAAAGSGGAGRPACGRSRARRCRSAARAGTAPRACRRRGSHRPARCW